MRIYDAGFDHDGSLWIANDEGLNKYDPGKDRYVPEKFNTLIRQVSTGKDSVLFRGTYYNLRTGIDGDSAVRVPGLLQPDRMIPELSHRFNSVKFSYSAVSFEMEDQNVYQYMLEGFDKEWSKWKPESSKEYSNLPPGEFAFRVRAKNIYGIESDQAVYWFTILPPWYRTIWAYLGYLLAIGMLIRMIVKFNLRRLQARNQVLEESVKERTAEVVRQKEEIVSINQNLLLQQEELKTTLDNLRETQARLIQSEKMASLGQLMAGIAHEINTPLGAIKASVSEITIDSRHILTRLPGLIRKLDDQQFSMFLALVNRSAGKSIPASSREKRKHKKDLQELLEDQGVTDPGYKADTLVDMGIYGDIGPFTDLLKLDHIDLLPVAYHLSQLMSSSRNIQTAIERASKIVFAMKNYSHQDISEERVEANIAEGIATILTFYQNQLKRGIRLTTKFEPIPLVSCYPDELNQVWTNLINNAIDAMNGKGELAISVSQKDGHAVVRISDSGTGIPASIQPRIFDAFYSTKPAGEGTGLGLFIAKEIIDKHCGKIFLESAEGQGTTFTISLPLDNRQTKSLSYDNIKKGNPLY